MNNIYVQTTRGVRGEVFPNWVFGFRIKYLPDFLSDHTLLGEKTEQRIYEHARRWTQFVGGLWSEDNICYSLRYHFEPDSQSARGGALQITLIARLDSEVLATNWLQTLELRMRELGFSVKMLSSFEIKEELERVYPNLVEVGQRDLRVRTKAGSSANSTGHYVVLPWWGMGGPFLVPIQVLCAQRHRCCVTISLLTTTIKKSELDYVAEKAAFGAKFAATSDQLDTRRQITDHVADPQAAWLGQICAAQYKRLQHQSFYAAAICSSESETAALTVATAMASGISEEMPFETSDKEAVTARSHAMITVIERDREEMYDAIRHGSFYQISSQALDPSRLGAEEEAQIGRLRYLVDARGAATVFRFPVNIRGGVPGIAVRQIPPDFNPGPARTDLESPILLGCRSTGDSIRIPLKAFSKHALITGFTGSGKTFTVLHLLEQLWRDYGVPFLVIESAKAEYRGLVCVQDKANQKAAFSGYDAEGLPHVLVYTLGNESCAPFRLNPFELQQGVRLETHLGRLQACFEAAIPQGPMGGPIPSLLSDALPLIYEEKGWSLLDCGFPKGRSPFPFPRMKDLRDMLDRLITEKPQPTVLNGKARGYTGETLSNVRAFVSGRVGALLQGSKGMMFDVAESVPLDHLFTRPAILELNDLNEADKGMVVMFLLVLLREYRETHSSRNLTHVTVVEEAHNVLSNPSPGSVSEAQEKAVQAFCNMLTEIRALGEGLVIADQSPQKLARDAIRNTNVQVTHQLRDSKDREAMADCTLMTEEQRNYLGKVETGWASVFFTGSENASFIKIPNFDQQESADEVTAKYSGKGRGFGIVGTGSESRAITDDDVKRHMAECIRSYANGPLGAACAPCRSKCLYRERIVRQRSGESIKRIQQDDLAIRRIPPHTDEWKRLRTAQYARLVALAGQTAHEAGLATEGDPLWCAFAHLAPREWLTASEVVGKHRDSLAKWAAKGFAKAR